MFCVLFKSNSFRNPRCQSVSQSVSQSASQQPAIRGRGQRVGVGAVGAVGAAGGALCCVVLCE